MSRSRFLTHWTGKNIATDPNLLDDDLRSRYIERLFSLLEKGFWMTTPVEHLRGFVPGVQSPQLSYVTPMTCFSELRLSGALPYFTQYGLMGIVVDRSFVLDRWGGPVHYVRSHAEDAVVGNLLQLLGWLRRQVENKIDDAKTIQENLHFLVGTMKAMSNPGTDDFAYLDEHEWRIMHSYFQEKSGRIVRTGQDRPKYLVPFSRTNIAMIVVPDTEIRSQLVSCRRFLDWTGSHIPPILTVEEVRQL